MNSKELIDFMHQEVERLNDKHNLKLCRIIEYGKEHDLIAIATCLGYVVFMFDTDINNPGYVEIKYDFPWSTITFEDPYGKILSYSQICEAMTHFVDSFIPDEYELEHSEKYTKENI